MRRIAIEAHGVASRYLAGMPERAFPVAHHADDKELLLDWLGFLRGAVARKASVGGRGAHWRPRGRLLSLVGIVNHLTRVEWRRLGGGFLGTEVERSEAEFHIPERRVAAVLPGRGSRGAPGRRDGAVSGRGSPVCG